MNNVLEFIDEFLTISWVNFLPVPPQLLLQQPLTSFQSLSSSSIPVSAPLLHPPHTPSVPPPLHSLSINIPPLHPLSINISLYPRGEHQPLLLSWLPALTQAAVSTLSTCYTKREGLFWGEGVRGWGRVLVLVGILRGGGGRKGQRWK